MGERKKLKQAILSVCLGIFSFFTVFPFIWMFLTSLKKLTQIYQMPPKILPNPVMWKNYIEAFQEFPFARAYLNSAIITVVGVSFFIITSAMSAYAFSKISFPGRDGIFNFLLISLMIPFEVTMVPVLVIMKGFGLNNTLTACIIYAVFANTYGVFMIRQFIKGLPNDLIESAVIDGCGHGRIFVKIVAPLIKAPVSALVIFNFITNWNNFMQPLVFLSSREKYPVPLLLYMFQGTFTSRQDLAMAAACIAILPILVIYLIFQKNIIEGVAFSGLKA